MCEISKMPAAFRTARCSSVMLVYCTGISQPPNSINFPPSFWCVAKRQVRFNMKEECRRRNEETNSKSEARKKSEGSPKEVRSSKSEKPKWAAHSGFSSDLGFRYSDLLPPLLRFHLRFGRAEFE